MAFENLLYEVQGGIARITVNRPKALNALDAKTLSELRVAFDTVRNESSVGVAIITGAGDKAFVAGADISELAALDREGALALARNGQGLFRSIETLGKPVIAAVNGFALGGGCELALACSMRIASENARLGQPEVKLGVIPGYGGTQRLPRLVGRGAALELILSGEFVVASRALEMGLVNRVVPAAELMPTCEALAQSILAAGPVAVRRALEAVDDGLDVPLEDGFAIEAELFAGLFETEDAREGLAAFLAKRKAAFQGR